MSSAVPALDFGSMTQVIQFLMEIDKLKGVQRRTKVLGTQRQETRRTQLALRHRRHEPGALRR